MLQQGDLLTLHAAPYLYYCCLSFRNSGRNQRLCCSLFYYYLDRACTILCRAEALPEEEWRIYAIKLCHGGLNTPLGEKTCGLGSHQQKWDLCSLHLITGIAEKPASIIHMQKANPQNTYKIILLAESYYI